jgi:hypothetical protein
LNSPLAAHQGPCAAIPSEVCRFFSSSVALIATDAGRRSRCTNRRIAHPREIPRLHVPALRAKPKARDTTLGMTLRLCRCLRSGRLAFQAGALGIAVSVAVAFAVAFSLRRHSERSCRFFSSSVAFIATDAGRRSRGISLRFTNRRIVHPTWMYDATTLFARAAHVDVQRRRRRDPVRRAPKPPKLHTTPWTIFLYTNRYLREPPPSRKNINRILELRPIAPNHTRWLNGRAAPTARHASLFPRITKSTRSRSRTA